ncbi:MAG TPA: DUF1343 domain-containing protein [Capsulimonadaceae bacterium]|jgi:uncharacterized protein YbbC (DUF1343 family)
MAVKTGANVWNESGFVALRGKRIGFIGNHTAVLADGTPTLAALSHSPGVTVAALFGPEHGAFGTIDDTVPDMVEPMTGLPINSLYGKHKKPTPEMLAGIDALVFEMQDIGARFYTYASTLGLCLEACVESNIPLIVLDRPNPITGRHCEGPIADSDRLSFTAYHTIPVRHGLTLGELARLYAAELHCGESVIVAPCDGLTRAMWFDETAIAWRNPSPAMKSLDAATLYPGVCLLEQTNFSVGRGTATPFELIGAPYVQSGPWLDALAALNLSGVSFAAESFRPTLRDYSGIQCHGVRITITDRQALNAVKLGIGLVTTLKTVAPEFESAGVLNLLANTKACSLIESGASVDEVTASWRGDLDTWETRRSTALIYE